jgi:hypothetical protein
VQALQKRWDYLPVGLDLILDQRGADMADLPGGASGLLVRDYRGMEADRPIPRIDPEVVSLVAELRGHERQAAEEFGQGKTRGDHSRPVADRRGVGLVGEEGWRWRNRDGRTTRWSSPSTKLRAMVSLPKYSPPMARPPTGDRGWMA